MPTLILLLSWTLFGFHWLQQPMLLCHKCLLYPFPRHWSQAFFATDLSLSGFPTIMVRMDISRSVPLSKFSAHQHFGQQFSRFLDNPMYGNLGLPLLPSHVRFIRKFCPLYPTLFDLEDNISFDDMVKNKWWFSAMEDFISSLQQRRPLRIRIPDAFTSHSDLRIFVEPPPRLKKDGVHSFRTDREQSAPEDPTEECCMVSSWPCQATTSLTLP